MRRPGFLRLTAMFAAALGLVGCDVFLGADERVERAVGHVAVHDYQAAMIELKNAVQSEPDHPKARLMLSEVSLQLGDLATAEKELRRAIDSGATQADTAKLQAELRLQMRQFEELLANLRSGVLPLPERDSGTYRGLALLGLGQVDASIVEFQRTLSADPRATGASIGLADALSTQGRTEEALSALDVVLAQDSRHPQALLSRGQILSRRGRYAEAHVALESARHGTAKLSAAQRATLLAMITDTRLLLGDLPAAKASLDQLKAIASGSPLTRVLAGRIAMAGQDYAGASAELQRALTSAPDLVSARFLLGAALLAKGNLHQAEDQLTQVVQTAPENLEARKLLAQVRLRLEQPDAAMQVLLPAHESGSTDSQLHALLGLAHMQLGENSLGLALLERSAAAEPNSRELQIELAGNYLRSGEYAKAEKLLLSLPHDGQDTRRERLLIMTASAQHGMEAARRRVEQFLIAAPDSLGMLNVAAAFYATDGQHDRARALLGRALTSNPNHSESLLNAARIEYLAGDTQAAAARLEGALTVDKDNAVAKIALADLAVRRADLRTAEELLKEVRSEDREGIAARLALARIYLMETRTTEADQLLQTTVTIAPRRSDLLNTVGLLYLDARRYEQAGVKFREALDVSAGNAVYWLNLARTQLALDQRPAARESLEEALALRADWIPAVGALALLDVREQKRDSAVGRIERLLRTQPTNPEARVLEGDVYMALRQFDRASKAFSQALEMRPDSTTAFKAYRARAQGKLGDLTAPLEAWLAKSPDDFALRMVLAEAYQGSGQRTRAVQQYEFIVNNRSSSLAALNNLAWLYYELGDSRAEQTALRAYRLSPQTPAVADTYGWILVRSGKVAEGLGILREAARAAKDQQEIAFHYASALAESGDRDGARRELAAILANPSGLTSEADAKRLFGELSPK